MDINFICTRKRKEFGKPCAFEDVGPVILCEIDGNPAKRSEYAQKKTIDRQIDNTPKCCAHEINTAKFPVENRGMNHREGGWPASVDNEDEESMARFRKKVEKDRGYINAVKNMAQLVENLILENKSIDIYEDYFENERINRDTKWSLTSDSIFKDPNEPNRSVVDLSWVKDSTKFAAVYSLIESETPDMPCLHSYVWEVENNTKPFYVFEPDVPMTVVQFSPSNSNMILSGYFSGQVALWDIRVDRYPQQLSPVIGSHTKKVTGIKWLQSKEQMAFLSGSSDGTVKAWDCRNLSLPVEDIHLDIEKDHIPNLEENFSISCVEYDMNMPDNFMVGTYQGYILLFRRKYRHEDDHKRREIIHLTYPCQSGPLINLERNAFFPQLFLSCDTWSLKLWSENVTDAPVLNILTEDGYYTDVAWSQTRASTIYASKTTGFLEVWDLPMKTKEPLLNIKVDTESLLSVAVAESGNHVICGSLSGSIQLLKIPDYLRQSSEVENDYLKGCIKDSSEIIRGKSKSGIIASEESGKFGMDEDWWDPPDKAEDLYGEIDYEEFTKQGGTVDA